MIRSRTAAALTLCALACGEGDAADSPGAADLGPEGHLFEVAASRVAFGDVVGVLADSGGRIYVADAQAQEIVVLSADAAEIARIGGRGDGPGEFGGLRSIAWKADTLAALDLRHRRISLFDPDRGFASTIPWPSSAGRPYRLMTAGNALIAAGTFPRGSTGAVRSASEGAATFRQPEIRYFEVTGAQFREPGVRDTVAEPRGFDCDGPAGTIASFGNPLFGRIGPLRSFTTPNELISAEAESARLDVVDTATGDTTRSFRVEVAPISVSDSLWEQETAGYREREQREGPFSCNIDAMRPQALARMRSVLNDPSGMLWAELRTGPDQFAFAVLNSAGHVLTAAAAPPRDGAVAPYARDSTLYVVSKDEYDAASIRTYRLQSQQ